MPSREIIITKRVQKMTDLLGHSNFFASLCDVSPAGIGRLALPAPRGATDDRQVIR